MTDIGWKKRKNLENSLVEFLQTQATGYTVFYKGENKQIDIRVGNSPKDDWDLPVISCYYDSRTQPRGFVGQDKRIDTHLMIIDIRALDDGMRSDLADWVVDTINSGFYYYVYSPDAVTPSTPNKTLTGHVSVDFVSDNAIRGGENIDEFEKFRHNISINATISI